MKKAIALALCALMMVLTLAGCGGGDNSKTLKIGVIQYAVHPSLDNCYTGLVEGLKAAGYTEGDNLTIDFQNANGLDETATSIASNMAAKQYDLLVGIATPAAMALAGAAADTDTPVIFCAVSDPVSVKLVDSFETPGGSITGSSDLLNLDTQLAMIRAFQPDAKKIGVLYTTSEENSVSQLKTLKDLAGGFGFEIVEQGIQSAADIPQAASLLASQVDCINNFTDNNVVQNLSVLLEAANQAGIPVYGSEVEQVKNGCLASISLDYVALGKETGAIAARVLKGEDPAGIAVYQEKEGTPVLNPDVAGALGIAIPDKYADAEQVTTQG